MTVLLRDAIKPNLMQTLEGSPAFVHAGRSRTSPTATARSSPTASRSSSPTTSSTEAGFGADMGAEKFFDIKCRASGLRPDAAVLVATIRALKMHGGVGRSSPASRSTRRCSRRTSRRSRRARQPREADRERAHFGIPVVVAINAFPTDTPAEVEAIREVALAAGACDAVVADALRRRAATGAADLAEAVWAAAEDGGADFQLLYPDEMPRRGQDRDDRRRGSTAPTASSTCRRPRKQLAQYEELGLRRRCRSAWRRRHYSLSHDAALKGRPTGFTRPGPRGAAVGRARASSPALRRDADDAGAAGSKPGGENVDIDANGEIVGLF